MRRICLGIFWIAIMGLLWGGCVSKYREEAKAKQRVEISKAIFQKFSLTLKAELQKAIQEKGPAGAIEVCKKVSQEIEEKTSAENPDIISVRRISLKTRNPERHTPTEEEKAYLQDQEKQTPTSEMDSVSYVTNTQSDQARVYFPLTIGDPICLVCHGLPEQITPEIKEALAKNYPQDQATGYKIGDLRGAMVVTWKK